MAPSACKFLQLQAHHCRDLFPLQAQWWIILMRMIEWFQCAGGHGEARLRQRPLACAAQNRLADKDAPYWTGLCTLPLIGPIALQRDSVEQAQL